MAPRPQSAPSAACLAAGLITAWAASPAVAQVDQDITLSIEPSIDLTDSVLIYTTGFSSIGFISTGPINAGEALPINFTNSSFHGTTWYNFVGLYDNNSETGVVLAFPDPTPPTSSIPSRSMTSSLAPSETTPKQASSTSSTRAEKPPTGPTTTSPP
ncbi:MAG: hypothetical protein RIG82_07950 [Phycisphaeraceae bacterium]